MLYWSFWGMNAVWWLFWVALMVVFFGTLTPVPRGRARFYSDPLAILRRRYAAGELTTSEYEERRAMLLRDASERSKDISSSGPRQTVAPSGAAGPDPAR